MDSNGSLEDLPPDDSGYYDVFHTPHVASLSEKLAKDLQLSERKNTIFNTLYADLNLPVHK